MAETALIFKKAAKERFKDSEILKKECRNDIAFYMLGYVLECEIKYFFLSITGEKDIDSFYNRFGIKLKVHIDYFFDTNKNDTNKNDTNKNDTNKNDTNKNQKLYFEIIIKKIRNNTNIKIYKNKIDKYKELLQKFQEYNYSVSLRYSSKYSITQKNYPKNYKSISQSDLDELIMQTEEIIKFLK